MSRRTDLLQHLIRSKKYGKEKEQEQRMLTATAEIILSDFIDIALRGLENSKEPGVLIINLLNDSTVFMTGSDIEKDLQEASRSEDEEVKDFLQPLIKLVDKNDWSKNVLITLISDEGTRTFAIEAGRSQESLRAIAAELTG